MSARRRSLAVAALGVLAVLGASCSRSRSHGSDPDLGDASRGRAIVETTGCGTCHAIPGVKAAHGVVGPPLDRLGARAFIAGELPNTPANLVRWLRSPPSVEPHTAMPDLGLDEQQARDVAAFLEDLR